jgi:hypothetical protein
VPTGPVSASGPSPAWNADGPHARTVTPFSRWATPGACGGPGPLQAPRRWCYFVKYQFSGLMLSVVLCGVTPLRLLATSVSW